MKSARGESRKMTRRATKGNFIGERTSKHLG